MPDFKASFQPDETMTVDFGETNVLGEEILIPGPPGKSAYEYAQDGGYTGTEQEFAEKLAAEMTEAIPNPHSLTITGAVEATYDGSGPVSVKIPTDDHIKNLIQNALGVIENGTY